MRHRILSRLTAFLFCCVLSLSYIHGWNNPMVLPGLQDRSLGDPYIMKYNGYYYLYVSAGDRNIYCWRTKDLMEWSTAYICCTDETTAVAYAPEVVYWNGTFYMCTSPRGGGHYILTSDSPTGPFVHKTGNLGRDIDGSFFTDDDGKHYFYHANNQGIRGCTMPTNLSFGNDVDLGCCITGQWTEGPCMFKRNGLYYLLYTGNHVWTNGYRIDYAISRSGALSGFTPQSEQNPILVDTETPTHKALGHGTAFVGPDLDTYYFCYHNLQDNKARRLLNFERIAWCGDKLIMTGPTCWEQDEPLVARNDYFERTGLGNNWSVRGGEWSVKERSYLSQALAADTCQALFNPCSYDSYTAEFTLRSCEKQNGKSGCIFSYQNPGNYTEALIDAATNTFILNNYVNGTVSLTRSASLPADFNPTCWHNVRVEKNAKRVRVYIDGMRKFQVSLSETGGQIGYVTHTGTADFAYVAISPYVDGSGILDVSLPLPGMITANLCTEKSDAVRSLSSALSAGSATLMRCPAGSYLKYRVNVQASNVYNIGLRYKSTSVSHIRLLIDGEDITGTTELPNTRSALSVQTLQLVPIPAGHHILTLEVTDGNPTLYEYNIKRGVRDSHIMSDDFNNGFSPEWGYREGNWTIVNGQLESTGRYGKMLMGGFEDIHLTDYTVECDVIYTSSSEMNGGLLFRTTNASTGGADDNPVLGTDFLQGYIFLAGTTSVALGKHNFGWQTLATANKNISASAPHHMKVEVKGANIKCYLDDMEKPLINYTDPVPFITGRAGFRAHNSSVRFDNFIVTPDKDAETPVKGITADPSPAPSPVKIYNLNAQPVSPTGKDLQGIYIVREGEKSRKVFFRKRNV